MRHVRLALIAVVSTATVTVTAGSAPAAAAHLPGGRAARSGAGVSAPARMAVAARPGYWLAGVTGRIFTAGHAENHGSISAGALNRPIVGIASTPSGHGYWIVASDGGIFSFGDATFRGSTGAMTLNKPIVGIASTPTGHGYWIVASDGGIFAFGDATFHGSTGAVRLNRPIVGIATTPSGHGYWLVASDGGIFAFGDAAFHGSTGGLVLNQPIVGAASTPSGRGYWFVAADGGVFAFGDAPFLGSGGATSSDAPIVAIAAAPHPVAAAPPAPPPTPRLRFSTEPSATSRGGAPFARQPVVTVRTASGATAVAAATAVTLTITRPAGATLTCASNPTTPIGGIARFSGCSINRRGTYTLTATDGISTATSGIIVVAVGPAAKVRFVQQPSGATSLVDFATQPHVAVQDLGGNTVTTTNAGTVALSITAPAGARLVCTNLGAVIVKGIAAFSGCHIDRSGTYTLRAGIAGLAADTSAPLSITAAAAAKLAFTTSPGDATGGVAFAQQPVVAVQDASGNPVTTDASSVVLTITTPAGAALDCTGGTAMAVVAGVASFVGCSIDRASATPYTLHAEDAALTAATSGPTTISVGPATHLGFTRQPSASTGGIPFGTQPQVTVQDAGANTVTTAVISVTLSINTPGAAALACTSANPLAAVDGVATFTGCNIDRASATPYTLHAVADGLPAADSLGTRITVGPAARLAFTTQPTGSTGGVVLGRQPAVAVQDAGGNTVTGNRSPVTLTITQPSAPAGATLTCASANPLTPVAGVSGFFGCKINLASAPTYTLLATVTTGPAAATSNPLTVTVGVPAQLVFSRQPSASTLAATVFAEQPRVTVEDAGGNPVTADNTTSITLDLTRPSTPFEAVLTCTASTVMVTAGAATFTGCSVDLVGNYTLTAHNETDALTIISDVVDIT